MGIVRAKRKLHEPGDEMGIYRLIENTGKKHPTNKSWIWLCECTVCGKVEEVSMRLLEHYRRNCPHIVQEKKIVAHAKEHSLCWTCIRAASPPELQCIWVKSGGEEMVEGSDGIRLNAQYGYLIRVTNCPMFLDEKEPKNKQILEDARAKQRLKRKKEQEDGVSASSSGHFCSSTESRWMG